MRAERFDVPLRIVVDTPVPGFVMRLQSGATAKAEWLPPASASAEALAFDFTVSVDGVLPDGRPRLLGPVVQGPPAARFVYLTIARVTGPSWSGRAKVPLKDLSWAMIETLPPDGRLCAHYNGAGRGGLPACATVPLTQGWAVIPSDSLARATARPSACEEPARRLSAIKPA